MDGFWEMLAYMSTGFAMGIMVSYIIIIIFS